MFLFPSCNSDSTDRCPAVLWENYGCVGKYGHVGNYGRVGNYGYVGDYGMWEPMAGPTFSCGRRWLAQRRFLWSPNGWPHLLL